MYFTCAAHLSLYQPHFECSVVTHGYFINSVALGYQSGPRWLFGNKRMKSLGKGSLCLQRALFGPRDSDKAMEIRFLWVIVAMFPKEGIHKLWCIPMMEYYAIRMNGLQIHATIRMNHTNITFSERNQIQKVHTLCIQLHYKKAGKTQGVQSQNIEYPW